jgi:hypothetical protein
MVAVRRLMAAVEQPPLASAVATGTPVLLGRK